MAQILAWPFNFTPSGAAATVDQKSEQADAQQIGVLILTRQGERELEPGFGLPDPVFAGIDKGAIANGVRLFGPPVNVVNVKVSQTEELSQLVQVEFR